MPLAIQKGTEEAKKNLFEVALAGSTITHPVVGERICAPLKSLRLVLPIIRYHHERLDGSGYPDGLKGDEIPLTARILQTVDLYDAFTTQRPYKPAYSSDQAFAIMREEAARGWWDLRLIELFGSLVKPDWLME